MIKVLLFSVIGLIVGGGMGVGGAMFLAPAPSEQEGSSEEVSAESEEEEEEEGESELAYADFSEQFIVPLMSGDTVEALMVISISLEVNALDLERVYDREPKLRSAFLQSLFNHANNGGFSGNFTQFSTMASLKRELLYVAQDVVGETVSDILILDAVRQE